MPKRLSYTLFVLIALFSLLFSGLFFMPVRAQDCTSIAEGSGCKHGLPEGEYAALLAQMDAYPAPAVTQIGVEADELRRYSFWQIDRKDVTFYDSPGGVPLETSDPGYSFVVPRSKTEGWVETEPGKWVSTSNLSGTRASAHTGVLIDAWPLPLPMGWVLQHIKPSLTPGARALKSTPVLPQYTRVNIYKTVQVGAWEWYLVGPGQWVEQRRVGRLVPTAPPGVGGRWIGVDLYEQVMTAYEGDRPVFATLISSGLRQWPTSEGLFKIWAKLRHDAMTGSMGRPDYYNIPVVPYVMYFNNSQALHGAFWHNGFGYRHSHGCVNLSVGDARWLFDWSVEGTPVYVYQSR